MVKRLATSHHDPLGITDSACKNQLVVVSVQYGPFNTYIPIRSTTISKSRVARDPIAMHTSWRSNASLTGYPHMKASGESSTTKHRLLHASGPHPIPPPNDPNVCLAFGVTVDYVWNSNVFYELDFLPTTEFIPTADFICLNWMLSKTIFEGSLSFKNEVNPDAKISVRLNKRCNERCLMFYHLHIVLVTFSLLAEPLGSLAFLVQRPVDWLSSFCILKQRLVVQLREIVRYCSLQLVVVTVDSDWMAYAMRRRFV
ncbi:hypothetical protein F511_39255 [Dorcoceras hygrometricum]|uniref:Uncharacterized protein n=1 Tax=Dorcoceras hygrometricum TaxID=472368 RepID=A0A2Z7A8R6_9LAMI|nr:hypothetical protein F511_39255 [Dorcoceras hygrometricum]